ncbi:MAG TPA: hypothetical protein VM686_18100 [Polyangiaceae bacterium]|nr:hypothetical protein [Polyangiaceae bacterium]
MSRLTSLRLATLTACGLLSLSTSVVAQEPPQPPAAAEPAPEPAPAPAAELVAPAAPAPATPPPAETAAPVEGEFKPLPEGGGDSGFVASDEGGGFIEEVASKLDIYGFADFNYFQLLNAKDTAWTGYRRYGTFFVGHLNLYLSADLAEQWRTLMEVRFTYLPHGDENPDPTTGASPYTNTSVTDYAEYEKANRWGSIIIERAWLEYSPFDFLSVRGGQYLTPYGFWNEDHGTPVIIPIQRPFVIGESLFPERQTGLEAHLRHPIDRSTVGLHLTLSNGRGPIDMYKDLDGNKAIGASAYLSTEALGDLDISAAVYKGQYTDSYEQNGLDTSGPTPELQIEHIKTVQYDEFSLAGGVRFRYEGLHVQSEIVMNEVAFDDRYRPESVGIDSQYHAVPDYRRWGAYGLIGYRTPWLGLMPYFMYQFNSFADQEMNDPGHGFTPGVNMRPTPNVVLKVEYCYAPFDGPGSFGINKEPLQMFATQAAWAF